MAEFVTKAHKLKIFVSEREVLKDYIPKRVLLRVQVGR
jgi:hypothetical protein